MLYFWASTFDGLLGSRGRYVPFRRFSWMTRPQPVRFQLWPFPQKVLLHTNTPTVTFCLSLQCFLSWYSCWFSCACQAPTWIWQILDVNLAINNRDTKPNDKAVCVLHTDCSIHVVYNMDDRILKWSISLIFRLGFGKVAGTLTSTVMNQGDYFQDQPSELCE